MEINAFDLLLLIMDFIESNLGKSINSLIL